MQTVRSVARAWRPTHSRAPSCHSHCPFLALLSCVRAGKAGGDPAKMSDAQIKAYLAAHPELAKQALSSTAAVSAQPSEAVSAGSVAEWGAVSAASSKPAAPAKGGLFGSVFGGAAAPAPAGKSMTAAPAPAPAPAAYVPPSLSSGGGDVENPFGSSSAPAPAAASASAPPAPPGVAAGEENPFAS